MQSSQTEIYFLLSAYEESMMFSGNIVKKIKSPRNTMTLQNTMITIYVGDLLYV